jgi:hypothetical protein
MTTIKKLLKARRSMDRRYTPPNELVNGWAKDCRTHFVSHLVGGSDDGLKRQCFARVHMGRYFVVYDFAQAACKRAGGDGTCWLSKNGVSQKCGIARDTAKRYLKWLIDNGWIEVVKKPRPGYFHTAEQQSGKYRAVPHHEWTSRWGSRGCL